MSEFQPVSGKLLTKPFVFLSLLVMLAFAILGARFLFGLGAVTNLNDGYPWGIWVVIDVMIGTAFGCAGYAVALMVYVLNKGEYHPLVRSAVLAGLFGYTLGGMAVIFDLGRYWQFYTLLMPGYINLNSAMLEVALCVMAYVVVLWIEFSPAFLERLGLKDLNRKLGKLLFFIVALGVLLPTMHQSSLGTLATVFGHRLEPLWQTQLLPLLFLLSALLMGFAIVPFESLLASFGFARRSETPLLARLAGAFTILLGVYLVIRFGDIIVRGALGDAFALNTFAVAFWLENILFIAPFVVLLKKENRYNQRILFASATSLLLAGSIYRLNTYIVGFHPAVEGWSYFPSAAEIMVTVGIFSLEVVLYLIVVKKLPVLPRAEAA
ncbi:MAG: Ni/Fe-hydrogenase cytochrome b subunit [Pseudomonadota bacterium]|nr:MAG: Ni/Fe-hydrogenase cytochrome b subunit [Pseudomonadota bacterium]